MSVLPSHANHLHARALDACRRYQQAEAELIGILQEVDEHRVYLHRGHSSLFQYVVRELGLAESAAYSLISVARKAREVPELKAQLEQGAITLSNARRIVPLLTRENQSEWIAKASELSHRQLEKEIVRVRPQAATPERARYVTPGRVKLELGLSEKEMLKLRRVQDLLSQSRRRAVSLEEAVEVLTSEFLRRNDPVEKAKRHQVRNGPRTQMARAPAPSAVNQQTVRVGKLVALKKPLKRQARREPLSAALLHQVNLRDERRCAHILADGSRCNETRWIEIHHKVPVSEGGGNTLQNLITLCSGHHRMVHAAENRAP